jgi:hypothetical protein
VTKIVTSFKSEKLEFDDETPQKSQIKGKKSEKNTTFFEKIIFFANSIT